jgi:hypothetical protein
MTTPTTVPIRRDKPRPPWHARLGVLRLVVGVLAVLVLGEGLLLLHVERRLNTMVQRLNDTRTLNALGLGDRPGKLLLITADDLEYSVGDARSLQVDVDAWTADFVGRHSVEPELAEMLAGVMSSHVTAYADARIQAGLGSLRPEECERYFTSLQTRLYRTAELLLGQELGSAFAKELDQAWGGLTG